MAARSMASSTITFGLVAVPVRLYPAVRESAGLSFHLLHAKDGVRLRQQLVCPKDGDVVPRNEAIKGYEYSKGDYVTFTDKELKALDQKASAGIEVREFMHQLFHADEVRKRIRGLIDQKVEGGELKAAPETRPQAKVVDLMEALKASLARRGEKVAPERSERAEKSRKTRAAPARPRAPLRKAG